MPFPTHRPRRLRATPSVRELVRETTLAPFDFIYPLFIVPGERQRRPVGSMPGVSQLSVDEAVRECEGLWGLGLRAVILFGLPPEKDAVGSGAYDPHGPVQACIKALKQALPDLYVITDVCLCEYTSHGHCGVLEGERVLNDPTLEILAREALSHAEAGADMVAPSDMMDGRVAAIRQALDAGGFADVPIMSYAVKYASGFYGPFREAADSAPAFGDRRSYQMDPGNAREALREAALDEAEGADMLMVKPALPYLDILWRVRQQTTLPLAAYHVSGEFAMIKAAAANGWIDEPRVVLEAMTAVRRAGADLVLTYHTPDLLRWLAEGRGC
ncbi:MAG: porphobilinogen synthase [Candidatus Sericytochromatia bacterium]|nr:porphobilinogen synthase [Candidatus Sericytochromatia bacterium]